MKQVFIFILTAIAMLAPGERLPLDLASDSVATEGNRVQNVVVIPVEFPDIKFLENDIVESVNQLFNVRGYSRGGSIGSVSDYIGDNNLPLSVSFLIAEKVTVAKSSSYYGANTAHSIDAAITELVLEASSLAAEAGVDFSNLDGDNDGLIDHIMLFYAGVNESESGLEDRIRPQSGSLSQLHHFVVNKMIGSYSCCSELGGKSDNPYFTNIGTICHEYIQSFGVPDMYDVNDETEGLSNALYKTLSLMSYGNFNDKGRTPPLVNAVEREVLGCLEVEDVVVGRNYRLEPIEACNKALRINTTTPGEYFLIEYRRGTGWDAGIGGSGVVVYHVDRSDNLAGSMTASMRWNANAVNCCASHPCVYAVNVRGSKKVEDVFYPGSGDVTQINSLVNIPLLSWSGEGTCIGIDSIANSVRDYAEFTVIDDSGWDIPFAEDCIMEVDQHQAILKWRSKSTSDRWEILWGASSDVYKQLVEVGSSQEYGFSELIPGERYECDIYAMRGALQGKVTRAEFRTIPAISDFPLIAEMRTEFQKGDSIRLHIINLEPYPEEIHWIVDGAEYQNKFLIFDSSGDHKLTATYMDGDGVMNCLEKKYKVK